MNPLRNQFLLYNGTQAGLDAGYDFYTYNSMGDPEKGVYSAAGSVPGGLLGAAAGTTAATLMRRPSLGLYGGVVGNFAGSVLGSMTGSNLLDHLRRLEERRNQADSIRIYGAS